MFDILDMNSLTKLYMYYKVWILHIWMYISIIGNIKLCNIKFLIICLIQQNSQSFRINLQFET